MRRPRVSSALLVFLGAAISGASVSASCSAVGGRHELGAPGGGTTSTGAGGAGGASSGPQSASASGVGGDISLGEGLPDLDGGAAAKPDVAMNPCGTACGPTELCDPEHLGLDDDCDGQVDEDCTCITGQAHACFKGDPSYHNAPGCFDGTERCDENGFWGPCFGGVHATESCFSSNPESCHPIQAAPFADVHLKTGTGTFSTNAVQGTETWTVACPSGVSPCPAVAGTSPADEFKPLQSGEYTVTYTKGLTGGGKSSCTYPLFVGAPGLRVELEWEHDLGGTGVDLDLHMHQPDSREPWSVSGSPFDCGYANCTIDDLAGNSPIHWFSDTATPPSPVNWYLDPTMSNNTCYYAPRGAGQSWQANGRGCHNPRLDIDNINCIPSITDPNAEMFCAPENINIDFPPERQWTRIGVHYYSRHGLNYQVHPRVKIYCDGALGAELGPSGYYEPESPVTFTPDDSSVRYWLVADVAFSSGACGRKGCVVVPLYEDPVMKTPFFTTQSIVSSTFGPPYPPAP